MSCKRLFLPILALVFFSAVLSAAPDIEVGKNLFKNNCAACHNKSMKDDMTGPALSGFTERWSSYPKEDLYSWIRNSQGLVKKGHPKATELFAKWKSVMTPFPNLTDDDIESLILYVNGVAAGTYGAPAAATQGGAPAAITPKINPMWYYGIALILLGLAVFLWNIMSQLTYYQKVAAGDEKAEQPSLWRSLRSRAVLGFLLFALFLFGGYTTVNNAISLGRSQNYAPTQPIKFSHAVHAGLHKIDCKFCHDGARRSKQSVIPGAGTCVNCHKAIKKGSRYGTEEITKIFVSAGFDPSKDKYIENYDQLSNEEIGKIYKDWIGTNWMKQNEVTSISEAGQSQIDQQWARIVKSMTSNTKQTLSGPIEWVRLHNLPDYVYFNHSQHVTVGKLACQTCHGKVEEMDVMKQYSTLSMGWCINCHRQSDVQFKDNKYYDSYRTFHDELKAGTRQSVKVSDIGGLDCQKCHY